MIAFTSSGALRTFPRSLADPRGIPQPMHPKILALVLLLAACKNGAAKPPLQQKEEPAAAAAPAAVLARASGDGRTLTPEEAHRLLPRADITGLTPEQLGVLHEVAGDTFDYAGCNSTLAACLRGDVKDKHAPRMARLAGMLIREGLGTGHVVDMLERYYASFQGNKRAKLRTDDCAAAGPKDAPVQVVEYSDYQCPHCATVSKPLREMVDKTEGKVRLCAKYFPLKQHAQAGPAAAAAEYAREKGKFWEVNELFFEHQDDLGDAALKSYAAKLGLDGDEMLKQVHAGKFQPVIDRHIAEASAAGLRATPSVYFNGRSLTLPIKIEYLLFSTEDELEWIRGGGAWEKE